MAEPKLVLERAGMSVEHPVEAVELFKTYLKGLPVEHFIALPLTSDHKVINGLYEVAVGDVDQVDPGDSSVWLQQFKEMGAEIVITGHNHPSVIKNGAETSMASASMGDFGSFLYDLQNGERMGVDTHIHIIVGPNGDTSDIGHTVEALDAARFHMRMEGLLG